MSRKRLHIPGMYGVRTGVKPCLTGMKKDTFLECNGLFNNVCNTSIILLEVDYGLIRFCELI